MQVTVRRTDAPFASKVNRNVDAIGKDFGYESGSVLDCGTKSLFIGLAIIIIRRKMCVV